MVWDLFIIAYALDCPSYPRRVDLTYHPSLSTTYFAEYLTFRKSNGMYY